MFNLLNIFFTYIIHKQFIKHMVDWFQYLYFIFLIILYPVNTL